MRIFAFGAAFPFFNNNVDEQAHVDLVIKYARGHVPAGLEPWDRDAAALIVLYDTPEYLEPPDRYPGGNYGPPHRLATAEDREAFDRTVTTFVSTVNHECTQPPVYYAVAGLWYRIGKAMGYRGAHLLYWLRFLNVAVGGVLVVVSYATARAAFPENAVVKLGVPVLVAFLPQDSLYTVNNDVLLPLIGGLAFLGLLHACRGAPLSTTFHAGTGLLVAAAVLVKLSAIPFLALAVGMVAYSVARAGGGMRRAVLTKGAVLIAAAVVPVAGWCLRNMLALGDFSGSAAKTEYLGWTLQPLGQILHHPIFSISGLAWFWQETLSSFWRGELVWGARRLASFGWDRFYSLSSLVLLGTAAIARRTLALGSSLALFLLSLAFLAAISVAYDFGDCTYPSRALPFLTSGRLISGALIPFAMLYVSGLDALLARRAPAVARWAALLGLVVWMTVSELWMSAPVFASAYNWYHL